MTESIKNSILVLCTRSRSMKELSISCDRDNLENCLLEILHQAAVMKGECELLRCEILDALHKVELQRLHDINDSLLASKSKSFIHKLFKRKEPKS